LRDAGDGCVRSRRGVRVVVVVVHQSETSSASSRAATSDVYDDDASDADGDVR
jgi:hypothetical protein